MSFQAWLKAFFPAFSLWVLLLITWPIEGVYLARHADAATLVACQLAQLLFFPPMAFCVALGQPLSHEIAKLRGERPIEEAKRDPAFMRETSALLDEYVSLAIVPIAVALALIVLSPALAGLLTGDAEEQAQFVGIMRWRAAALPFGYLAGIGDYVAFGVGLPVFANVAVVSEAAVYATFVFVAGAAIGPAFGVSPGAIASMGVLAKFVSTILLYLTVYVRRGIVRRFSPKPIGVVVARLRKVFQNSLIGFSTEAARGAMSPIMGHIPVRDATVITMIDRVGIVFTSFSTAQRVFLFSRGSDKSKLQREMMASLGYITFFFAPLFVACVVGWRALGAHLQLSEEVLAVGLVPLALRILALFLEVVANSLLTMGVLFPGSTRRWLKPGNITLAVNWMVWLPMVWALYVSGSFTATTYVLTIFVALAIQIALAVAPRARAADAEASVERA